MAYVKTTWINNTTALNATNMNHIEDGIEANDQNKVDKVTSTGLEAYVHNGSTQAMKVISNSPASGQIPMYDSSSRIKTATPSASTDCANKDYVDGLSPVAYTDSEIDDLLSEE